MRAANPAAAVDPGLAAVSDQHFERSKLVVLGLATKDARQADWDYERELAGTLLSDTRLYRAAAEERGMQSLAGVMRDLELVLLQTSMSEQRDAASLEQLQRLIRRRDLITKMEIVHAGGEMRRVLRASRCALCGGNVLRHVQATRTRTSGRGPADRGPADFEVAMKSIGVAAVVVGLVVGAAQGAVAFEPADSPRLARAKDLISEERWTAAIPELRAAVNDRKEQNKDEVLFWLAHSQNQAGDLAEAVESIRKLQANYPKSRWKQPAGSLMIELAQKLGRRDLLWLTAVPPPPPVGPRRRRRPPVPVRRRACERAARRRPPPAAVVPRHRRRTVRPRRRPPPAPPTAATWFAEAYLPDTDLRVQALGRLIPTDAPKVIPILRNIALEADNPGAARRAVFILAQSRNPQAQSTVVDVAKVASETVRVAAVRELARFGGPNVGQDLLEVYSRGNAPVKQQVVFSLGERADTSALFRIVQTENDDELRDAAILTLGRAGGREQLRVLFVRASKDGAPGRHPRALPRPRRRRADQDRRTGKGRRAQGRHRQQAAPARHAEGEGVSRVGEVVPSSQSAKSSWT